MTNSVADPSLAWTEADPFLSERNANEEAREHMARLPVGSTFSKHAPARHTMDRRESLLTRQLHASESESQDEDRQLHSGVRAHSHSSAADLTSDNDVTSPGTRCSTPSPPLPATHITIPIPSMAMPLVAEPAIVGHDISTNSVEKKMEHNVESGLGRRRCVTFACGAKKQDVKETPKQESHPAAEQAPPKRKCALTFVCPSRSKPAAQRLSPIATRHMSPAPSKAPKSPRSPRPLITKIHRNSDATITNLSPVALRKVPSFSKRRQAKAKYADAPDEDAREAKRFHEFAVNSKDDDDWTEVSTVYRKRLTVNDTLEKENVFRKLGQEVEEDEAEEDDEAILDELELNERSDGDEDDDDEDMSDNDEAGEDDLDNLEVSDGGFSTDDEHGFANSSESDGEGSDYEWWAPGRSTAATSTDQLELIRPTVQRKMSDSSLESAREANGIVLRRHKQAVRRAKGKSGAVKIERAPTPELPDSTDFVCGTLDEDRPLEQAYLSCMQERHAAKHKFTPQDIDPTFPTSDLEDDDEEDELSDKPCDDDDEDDAPLMMAGRMELHDERQRGRDRTTSRRKTKTPSPRRFKSPAPVQRITHRSPPPPKKREAIKAPPPPATRRCRSPPPRKLFGHSPMRARSPAPPISRPASPPNSRSSSKEGTPKPTLQFTPSMGLAIRPVLRQASSLPRVPTMTSVHNLASFADEDDEEGCQTPDRRNRGAIDIVKGLEKKRARRREKLYQKQCQKAKKDSDKRCKPGKGAERMRELGLELAAYRGKKAEHILSI